MNKHLSKVFVGLVALAAVLFGLGTPAQATTSPSSLTVSGFVTMKSTLTSAQTRTIRNYVAAHPGSTSVSCVGYTGYNYLGASARTIRALATDRARRACAYAAARTGATVGSLSVRLTSSQSASIRKVVLTFSYAVSAGRYQYSMSNLDEGSVLHGGPVTGFFHAGDVVASTFADTAWSLDGNTGPEYGYMGSIDGGSAAYFSHWNTRADDTGTSYQLGDHLGPIPDGTTVTLYAIAATG